MAAFVIAEVEVTDMEGYLPYTVLAGESVAKYGGRFRVRGGPVEELEGWPVRGRVVVIEFPDVETARTWYGSPEYQAAIPVRQANSAGRLFLVDGYDPT
jgi:uncharacterized protein (DUF1330 family)